MKKVMISVRADAEELDSNRCPTTELNKWNSANKLKYML